MKYRKILLISLFTLFLIHTHVQGQSESKEELGNLLVKSVLNKDISSFKSLLLPQELVVNLLEKNADVQINDGNRDELLARSERTYDNFFVPQREENFWKIVNLTETNKIDWSNLEFMILYKYGSTESDYIPFLVHSKLKNSAYKHFYFSAVRYKGSWYLEDNMELTKSDKYAAKD